MNEVIASSGRYLKRPVSLYKKYTLSESTGGGNSLFFRSDGLKMYMGDANSDYIYQYSLSTAWDIATTTYDNKKITLASRFNDNYGFWVRDNGNDFYALRVDDNIFQGLMSTAWDLDTGAYANKFFQMGTQDNSMEQLYIRQNGLIFYALGDQNNSIYQYSMSTAWNISTSSYDSISYDFSVQLTNVGGFFFKPDGLKFYLIEGGVNPFIYEYTLSVAWDLSTASYSFNSFQIFIDNNKVTTDIFFSNDGKYLYLLFTNQIYQYKLEVNWSFAPLP